MAHAGADRGERAGLGHRILGFGEDPEGEVSVGPGTTGTVFKLVGPSGK